MGFVPTLLAASFSRPHCVHPLPPAPLALAWEADLWVRNLRALLLASCLRVSESAPRQGEREGFFPAQGICTGHPPGLQPPASLPLKCGAHGLWTRLLSGGENMSWGDSDTAVVTYC